MKRGTLLCVCLLLVLPAAPALAKKKHKKKPVKLGPVVTVTATGNTAGGLTPESTATATCPAGKQAVGGGFSVPVVPGSALIVHDSYRSAPNAWTVAAQEADGSAAATAIAYCRKASPAITDVSASTTLSTNGENKTLSPSCPSKSRLIGGGFQSTVPAAGDAVVFPQVNQATTPSTWTVTGVDNQGGDTLTLTAHAYCMAKIPAPKITTSSASGSPAQFGQIATTTPSCPTPKKPKKGKKRKKRRRQLLSAGGFSSTIYTGSNSAMVFGESHTDPTGGWLASAVNGTNNATPVSVTSQGICF